MLSLEERGEEQTYASCMQAVCSAEAMLKKTRETLALMAHNLN